MIPPLLPLIAIVTVVVLMHSTTYLLMKKFNG